MKKAAPVISSVPFIKKLLLTAIVLVAPFSAFEAYFVLSYGYAEPYSYMFSIPLGVISYFLIQFAIGYGVVKGWANCRMPSNYLLMAAWTFNALMLWALPYFFPNKNLL